MSGADSLAGAVLILCGLSLIFGVEGDPGYIRALNLGVDPKGFGAVFTLIGVWVVMKGKSGIGRQLIRLAWKYFVPIVLMYLAFSILHSNPGLPYSRFVPVVLGDFHVVVVVLLFCASVFCAYCIHATDHRKR